MSVEVAVDDKMVDIVSAGFDAGIRFGNTIPEDLIAVRLGEELRWVAVCVTALPKCPFTDSDSRRSQESQLRPYTDWEWHYLSLGF